MVPGSLRLEAFLHGESGTVPDKDYSVDYFNALLIWKSHPYPDSVSLHYAVFPYMLTRVYYRKNPEDLKNADITSVPYTVETGKSEPYLNINGLDYTGSFARGISFGNDQDVVVNSSFNLQMSGKLANDVNINASITDNNIPIQPEGNTQQLQEFDKVFITLSKDGQSLTMGDFEVGKPPGYFMSFYKKLQGGSYTGNFALPGGTLTAGLSAAVARGIYSKQDIPVVEGNQGPYKLHGNNGETFIIILAGTERVYIDGALLTRGSENDYVIDYNAGEITFTPNRLLTKDKRVVIEFEYSDKNYFRSLLYSSDAFSDAKNKLHLQLNVYSEQDSKNQPIDQTLTADERNVLMQVGDSVQDAFTSGIDTLTFDASRIMYKMIDTLGYDSVFVYSTNPDSAKYVLTFTELGPNKGNYVQNTTLANGRVYAWVAPVAGIPQGTAEPVILLAAPGKSQMITLGGDYHPDTQNTFSSELAYSNYDANTFSPMGNADNGGIAWHGAYANTGKTANGLTLNTEVQYEFAGKQFTALERYRPVEFNRDWNIFSDARANEHFATADFSIAHGAGWNAGLESSAFIREGAYAGFRQGISGTFASTHWLINGAGTFLQSQADSEATQFLRPNLAVTRIFPTLHGWKFGLRYEGEHDKVYNHADSLYGASFYYDQYEMHIANADSAVNKFSFNIIQRNDALPANGHFAAVTKGTTYNINGGLNKDPNDRLSWQISYRVLTINDTSLTELKPENTLLGRADHTLILKKGLFTSDIFYEVGTGQEQKKEYSFVEVQPGLGVYTWNDYNGDGIPQLNEFEIAAFQDQANYIQVYVPTDQYIQTDVTQFNYVIGLNPKALWFDKKGLEGFLGRFSSQSSLQLNRKVYDDNTYASFLPFANIRDSLLVSSDLFWQNTVFFNRISQVFGIDYTFRKNYNRQYILNGTDSRGKNEHKISIRYKIFKPLTINLDYTAGVNTYGSEAFPDRNYLLPFYTISPRVSFLNGAVFKISGWYAYGRSRNTEGAETLTSHEFTTDMRYNVVTKSTITAKVSYIFADFSGSADSPVGYAMLNGLQDGANIIWDISLDKRLSNVLQMTLSYEGRKTGDMPIVHVGRVEIRAIF